MKTVDQILMELLEQRPAIFGAIFRGEEPETETEEASPSD